MKVAEAVRFVLVLVFCLAAVAHVHAQGREEKRAAPIRVGMIGFSLDDGMCTLWDESRVKLFYSPKRSECPVFVAWLSKLHPFDVQPRRLYPLRRGRLLVECFHYDAEWRSSTCGQWIEGERTPIYIGLGDTAELWRRLTGGRW